MDTSLTFWPFPSSTLIDPGAPKFTREPSDVAFDIGSNVTLLCLVKGHPEPQVTWKREDGLSIFNRPRSYGTITQSREGLHITSEYFGGKHIHNVYAYINKSPFLSDLWVEDEGVYICEAHNHFGTVQAQATISVTGLGKLGLFIHFCHLNSCVLNIGGNVLFHLIHYWSISCFGNQVRQFHKFCGNEGTQTCSKTSEKSP